MRFEPLEQRQLLTITTVDPSDGLRLMNSQVLGNWNTAGNYDGWTVANAASSSVANGMLTVTSNSSGNPAQISLTNIANGPYLNYGYFDYLQVRMELPVGFNQPLTFSFGTNGTTPSGTSNKGFSSDRQFTVPANQVATDGQFHVYRLDLGLTVWWKDTLTDLQLQPLGSTSAGQTAVINYVEVGDLPGDVLTVDTAQMGFASGVTMANAICVQSKHFAFWYCPTVNPGGKTNWSTMATNALTMLEESYQVYTKVQGYQEPFLWAGDGIRHKVNLTTWYGGYFMAGSWVNVDSSGLQDQGWGNPVPHEFGHMTDGQQPGFISGGDWESHANFHREAWVNWFSPYFVYNGSSQYESTLNILPLQYSMFRQDQLELIYSDYRVFTALENYSYTSPQNYPVSGDLEAQLWEQGAQGMTVWDKLAEILPAGENVKDIAAAMEKYWPMLDFQEMVGDGGTVSAGSLMRGDLWDNATDQANYFYNTTTMLVPEADNSGWYTIPTERAPEKYAYAASWLTPTAQTVTINLKGMNTIDPTQDWRWCLEEVDANNNVTYSAVWAPGTYSYTMNNKSDRLLLFVMATPGNTSEDLCAGYATDLYNTKPNDKNIDRLNYPYEVQITGAVPTTGAAQQDGLAKSSSGGYHKNPDGSTGGWVDSTATVASTAYVGPNARVLGSAQVLGTASIQDYAVVCGSAVVEGNAIVSGYSLVESNAVVEGNAVIRDHATVDGGTVESSAQMEDYATITSGTTLTDTAIARGESWSGFGNYTYSGNTILDYDWNSGWNETSGVHMGHFPWGSGDFGDYYDATQVTPPGLIASYSCSQPSGDLLWDEFGAEQAVLRGSPNLVEDPNFQSNVLALNGSSQYVNLDGNLADLSAATYAMWVDPTSSTANQALLYFGGSTGNYLELTARDANGYAHLTMSVGGVVKQLISTTAVPLNQWTNIALSLGGGTATFYINGAAAGSAAMSYVPRNVLGPNDLVNTQAFYLGRAATGNYFTGRMTDMRFYNVTLTAAQVVNEMNRNGALIGLFYNNSPMTFDGSTTAVNSGVHNGIAQTLEATIDPTASPNEGSFYQPILDSNYEYGNGTQGSGLGLNNGYYYVLLDGYGMWNTGVPVQSNTWQTVGVTFDGSVAKFYEYNGTSWVKMASLNYTDTGSNYWGMNYRIGYGLTNGYPGQSSGAVETYFQGQMKNVEIYNQVAIVDPGTYSWDTSATSGYQGGSGTWNTAGTTWSNGSGATVVAWPGDTASTAAFDTDTSGQSYTVSVDGNPTPYAVNFGDENQLATDQYTLSGGTVSVGAGGISGYVTASINSAVTLSAAQTWQTMLGQTLTVGGSVNTNGNALTLNPGAVFPFRENFGVALIDASGTYGGDYSGSSGNTTTGIGDAGGPTSGTTVLSGGVTGGGSLTMNGTGTLTLSGAGSYSGGTTLNGGTTILSNTSGSAAGSGTITVASTATLQVGSANASGSAGSDAITNNGLLEFDRTDSFTASGAIGGTGNLVQMGNGNLTLGSANTYTGPTYIAAGGLVIGNALALQDSTVNYATSGTTLGFATGVTSATLGGLQGSNNLSLQNASSVAVALSVGNDNQSTSFTGQFTGSGSLTKVGSGTFTISGASTYNGGTNVTGGTLLVNNTTGSGLGTGSVSVGNGGTLAGSGAISGAVSVASGGTLAASPGTVGSWTLGGLQLAGGSAVDLEFSGTANDTIAVSNSAGLTINGGGINLYQLGTTTPFAAVGTYQLFAHSGAVGGNGVSSLSVLNKVPGYRYSFGDTGTVVMLTIAQGPLWSGASGGVWSNAANWSGVTPSPNDPLVYATTGNPGGTSVNDLTNASFPSVAFGAGAAAFTLTGNAVTLTGDTNGNVALNQSSSTETLSLPITLGASGALNAAAGPIVLGSAGSIATSAGKGLTIQGSSSVTLNGTVTGSGGVTENAATLNLGSASALGSGTLTINGGTIDNSSGGALTVTSNNSQTWGGSFAFGGSNALNLGTGPVTLAANSAVAVNNGSTLTVGNVNGPSYSLTQNGNGTLSLSGSGSGTVSSVSVSGGGTLALSGASLTDSSQVGSINNGTLDVVAGKFTAPGLDLGHDGQVSDAIVEGTGTLNTTGELLMGFNMGAASLIVKGSGVVNGSGQTLEMGSANMSSVYVGLQDNASATFGSVSVANDEGYNDGQYGEYATLTVAGSAQLTTNSLTVGNNIWDSGRTHPYYLLGQVYQSGGSVTVNGTLSVALSKYTSSDQLFGTYNLSGGTLSANQITNGTASIPGTAMLNLHGGTLQYNGSGSQSNFITLGSNGAAYVYQNTTINDGGKSVTLNQPLLSPNSGSGVSAIAVPTPIGSAGTYPVDPEVVITPATGDTTGFGATAVANLNSSGQVASITVTNPGVGYTAVPTVQLYYDGVLTAVSASNVSIAANAFSGGLTKTGAGTLYLNAANTYAGPTTVSAGTLGGTGSLAGALTVSSGATLAPGVGGIGMLTVAGATTLAGTTVMEIKNSSGTLTSDLLQDGSAALTYGGTLTVSLVSGSSALVAGNTFTLFSAGSYAGYFTALNLPTLTSGLQWNLSNLTLNGSIAVIASNNPQVAAPAIATLSANGKTASLFVLGNDNGGQSNLKYTWSATGPASVSYSANGTNAANNTTATFSQLGTYTFTVTITNANNYSTTSTVRLTVSQVLTTIVVTPASVTLSSHGAQTFTAAGSDQFGGSMVAQPTFAWSAVSGTISSGGAYTAPYAAGSDTVTATSGSVFGTAAVTITNAAPTVAATAKADGNSPDTVTGTTTSLTVLGADSDGGGESNLSYTWSATGPASVTFTANGTNAAKNTTATFAKVGTYVFTATITDMGGLSTTSTVNVTVNQTATVTVTPASLTADPNSVRQFAAAVTDQFGGALLVAPPAVSWTASNGMIGSATGQFTAPTTGTATITATSGSASGTAAVTVIQPYGWWKFDGNGNDSSGQSTLHPATVNSGSYVAGVWNQALQLNGSSRVTFSTNPAVSGNGNFCVAAWVETTATAGTIIEQYNSTTNLYQLQLNSGMVQFSVYTGSGSTHQVTVTSTQKVNDGKWHQVTAYRNGNTVSVYIDGNSPASASATSLGSLTANTVVIGDTAGGSHSYFNGAIDDVRIYNSSEVSTSNIASLVASLADTPPTVATVAKAGGASPDTVTTTSTNLTVLGADNGGESNLTYTWSASGPAAVAFSANGTNAGKNATATFSQAGSYVFTVTIANANGIFASSSVNVTVNQTPTSIVVSPATANLGSGQSQQFTATGYDQFGAALSSQPAFTWSKVSGAGGINSAGLYTASYASGSATIQATGDGLTSNTVSVTTTDAAPTVATAAKADGSTSDTVTSTTAVLSVLGADSDGGGESNLSYTWTTTGTPPAAVNFSASNGTNAGKNTTATFTQAGSYTFTVTITDLGGQSTTSSVSLTVQQTATSCSISPLSASITAGGTQQFTAVVLDQFGIPLAAQPTWTWSVDGGGYSGMIDQSGLYTPSYAPGTTTVRVSGGGYNGSASVTVAGAAQWNSTGDSSWGGNGNWQDSVSNPTVAAPGVRSGLLGDTVLFAATTVPTVQLNGAAPTLAGITFTTAAAGYTLAADSGGSITLAGSQGASVKVQAGTQAISAPLALAGGTSFNIATQSSLAISGSISGSGSLSKTGDGTLLLSGLNKYTGGTIVTAGTLIVTTASAIADGTSLTVGGGAMMAPVSSASSAVSASAMVAPAVAASPAASETNVNATQAVNRAAILATPVAVDVGRGTRLVSSVTASPDANSPGTNLTGQNRASTASVPGAQFAPAATNVALRAGFGRSTSAAGVNYDLAWLRQLGRSWCELDQQRRKDAATAAMDAVLAQYAP